MLALDQKGISIDVEVKQDRKNKQEKYSPNILQKRYTVCFELCA